MSADWVNVATVEQLARKKVLVVRPQGRQIAVFQSDSGILACNNRCPHEGYPLSEGTLDGKCILTCNWHNWKFDLTNGENVYRGDRLRTYPVEIRGDAIWVDLTEAPFDERYAQVIGNLRNAFGDNDYERMARELGRLRSMGADPLDALRAGIDWSYERMEFGWTHAYAGVADWLVVHDEHAHEPEVQLSCVLESLGHIADDVLREDRYPFTDGAEAYDEDEFVGAIEQEDEARAVKLIRGALDAGLDFETLERGLARAALAHYNAFGHSVIYVIKAGRLITRLGESVAFAILSSLVREMIFARREDLIPEFRRYADAYNRWGTVGNGVSPSAASWHGLGINKSLDAAVRVSGAPARDVFDALLGATASNLLGYDETQQAKVRISVDDNIGWLDFTHGVTFAAAARELCEHHPDLWAAALLQMSCFVGRNTRYTVAEPAFEQWSVSDAELFFANEVQRVLDHDIDEFIVSVHVIKTLLAGRDLARAELTDETRQMLLAGLHRFLHSPVRLKHVRRTVHQAMQFVAKDG